jgi:hypothetical protein
MYENENYTQMNKPSWEKVAKFREVNNFGDQVTVRETYYTNECPVYDSFKVSTLDRSSW